MVALLDSPLPIQQDSLNNLKPRLIKMDSGAEKPYIAFCDDVERNLLKGGEYEHIHALANKLPEQAARIARVLELYHNLHTENVSEATIESAILLAEHYGREAKRLHERGYIDPDILMAERLLEWLETKFKGQPFTLSDIYQNSFTSLRTARDARRILMPLMNT